MGRSQAGREPKTDATNLAGQIEPNKHRATAKDEKYYLFYTHNLTAVVQQGIALPTSIYSIPRKPIGRRFVVYMTELNLIVDLSSKFSCDPSLLGDSARLMLIVSAGPDYRVSHVRSAEVERARRTYS